MTIMNFPKRLSIKATDTSALVKKAGYNTKFGDIEKKIIDHDYYSRTE